MSRPISGTLERCLWLTSLLVALAAGKSLLSEGIIATAQSAPNDKERPAISESDHAKREAAMQKALPGTVDLYADAVQIEHGTPLLTDVHFVDLVDVTGKELLRFADAKKHHWLIDPDAVIAFRVKSK